MAMLQVSDAPDAVVNFYKSELKKNGWNIITEYNRENHVSIVAEKGSNSVVIDAGFDQPGESMVSISLTPT